MEIKELSKEQSLTKLKQLVKRQFKLHAKDFKVGNVIFMRYHAKYKKRQFDKTPLMMVLRVSRNYTLGLNFHWIPFSMRMWLVKYIIKENKDNIRKNKPIEFSYRKVRPLLKKMAFVPCIRLYINKNISKSGTVIPPSQLIEVATLKMESFTNVPSEKLYNLAKAKKI